jgi:hypothetical protein
VTSTGSASQSSPAQNMAIGTFIDRIEYISEIDFVLANHNYKLENDSICHIA